MSDDAISAFSSAAPDISAARALRGASAGDLIALVTELEVAGKRDHLEVLGQAGLGKDIKKAARKAAYKLKSAGVEAAAIVPAAGLDLSLDDVPTDAALLVVTPIWGNVSLMLVSLARSPGGMIGLRLHGDHAHVDIELGHLPRKAISSGLRDARDRGASPMPQVCDLSLSVRAIDGIAAVVALTDRPLPTQWGDVIAWRTEAVRLGADPGQCAARAVLVDELAAISLDLQRTTASLLENPCVGRLLPPQAVVEALLDQAVAAVESDIEINEAQFRGRIDGIAASSVDAWLADEGFRVLMARTLEISADAALCRSERDAALQLLWLSDRLFTGDRLPHELDYFARTFSHVLDIERMWAAYVEHRGAARGSVDSDPDPPSGLIVEP